MVRTSMEIGYELLTQGRYSEARSILERAVAEYPKAPRAHLYLAIVLDQQGETARAEHHFTQAISLAPTDPASFYNWGAFLHRQGRLREALNAYETAYRLDPTLVGAMQAATALRQALGFPSAPPPPAVPVLSKPSPHKGVIWVRLGIFFSVLGLCLPKVGLSLGILCGLLAMRAGSKWGGLTVIVLTILLFALGADAESLMRSEIQSHLPR
ncbi:MAG: hypothetical protein C4336_00405 [Armatimonadota bacterium]